MTSDVYASLVLSLAQTSERYFKRIIKSLDSIPSEELADVNEDRIVERLGLFPRGSDEFANMIQKIVSFGRTNINESISALMRLFPLASEQDLFLRFLKNMRGPAGHSSLAKGFLRLCCGFIFADAVSGILSYATEAVDLDLLELVLELAKPLENNDRLFGYYWRRVKKQCSVIVGLISKYSFDQVNDAFTDFIQGINAENAKDVLLFRFIRFDPKRIRGSMAFVIDIAKQNRHTPRVMKALLTLVKYLVMQDVDGATVSMVAAANQYASKSSEFRNIVTEIGALILSKQKDMTSTNIAEFFESISLGETKDKKGRKRFLKMKVKMRCLLYLLSGNEFNEHMYWRNGRLCGIVFHDKEFVSCPGTDVAGIYSIMNEHLRDDEGESSYYVTEVFMNLMARNHIQTTGILLKELGRLDYPYVYSILDALWKMLTEKQYSVDNHCQSSILASVLRLCQQYMIKDPMKLATCPQFLSRNEKQIQIDPTLIPTPCEHFLDTLMGLPDDEARIGAKNADSITWPVLTIKYTSTFSHNRRENERILVMLICLLCVLPVTDDSVQCLLEFCMCGKTNIVQFALLACQILYLQNPSSREKIWAEIFKVVKKGLSESQLLTLLIQMYQLMSLGVNATDSWCDEMQIIILLHLASPYVCIRRVLLHMIDRMEAVGAYDTLFKTYRAVKHKVTERINARYATTRTVSFEDACASVNVGLYSTALSEFLSSITVAKYGKVISYFQSIDRMALQTNEPVENSQVFILTSTLIFRMTGILESGFKVFSEEMPYFSGSSYLEAYGITDPLVNGGFKDEAATELFTKLIDNYLETGNALVNHITANLSPFYLAQFLSVMATKTKEQSGDGSRFRKLTRLSEAMKEALANTDLQLCFYCYPSAFQDAKFVLLGFTVEIKKSGTSIPPAACVLINNMFSIVKQICQAIPYLFAAGFEGSLHQYRVPAFLKGNEWSVSERYRLLMLMKRFGHELGVDVKDTLVALARSGPVFRSESDANMSDPFVDENLSIILQYHPFLLDTYIAKAYKGDVRCFQAICELFYGPENKSKEASLDDIALNSDTLAKRDILLMLLFVYSYSEQKLALRTIRRLTCVFDGILNPDDISAISRLNYLADGHPEPEAVIRSALNALPGLATEVFAEGLSRLKQKPMHDLDFRILDVLGIIASFMDLGQRSAGFIVHVLDTYLMIPDYLHKRYALIFRAFCQHSEQNKQYLANCLCQLSAKDKRKEVIVTVVSLLAKTDPNLFVTRVVQSLGFGYWFYTNTYCSDFIQKGQEHIIYDDRQCCAEVVYYLAKKDATLITTHIARIVHFCLLFHDEIVVCSGILRELLDVQDATSRPLVVSKYKERYTEKDLRDWVDTALKWFTSCGSLDIAARSGEILMNLDHYSPAMIQRIVWSLNAVLDVKYKRKYKSVARYVQCALQLMTTILSNIHSLDKKMLNNIFEYLGTLRDRLDKDMQAGILSIYTELALRQKSEHFDDVLLYVTRFLTVDNETCLLAGLKFVK